MNVKVITKGAREKGNRNVREILQRHNIVQKPVVFHNASKPSPVLSDRSEFPSLNESSGKASNNLHPAEKLLKYSDKLKSHSFSKNQKTISEDFHSKNDTVLINTHNQLNDRTHSTKISNKWHSNDDKSNFHKKEILQSISQVKSDEPKFIGSNKVDSNSSQNVPKKHLIQSPKQCNSLNQQLAQDNKKELCKQKCLEKPLINSSCKTTSSTDVNLISKSNNQIQYNKSAKLIVEKNEEATGSMQCNTKEKKKKKRKSKVKRQVALQSGKITVLSHEVHLKILNQTSALTSQTSKSVITDINDEEEYPELGKPSLPASQKGYYPKKNLFVEPSEETLEKPPDANLEEKPVTTGIKESLDCGLSENPATEKKGKSDIKVAIHPNDPITISFYDILLNKNFKPKVRDCKDETVIPDSIGLAKIKTKKEAIRPHNLLDSSSPMIKRGKEREKPKPKRPSQLKKIILFDRKTRREQLLYLKSNNPVGNELVENLNEDELENVVDIIETGFPTENNSTELVEIANQTFLLLPDNSPNVSASQLEETVDQTLLQPSDNEENLHEFVPKVRQCILSETDKHWTGVTDISSTNPIEDIKGRDCLDNSVLSSDKICKNEKNNGVISSKVTESICSTEISLNVSHSADSLLSSLISNVQKSEISDKERAAKVLLHTRNFREYCNHLISKDIDDAVFSLLDDLARFQDRLHQKDPVKARMKKRMINGIKEVKKHIKLRKLKCIIIAVDIENVEAQGGLNDVLNDIKISAADHHIPCVFALSRKVLGKVCRKPVPVSCVGVLNFEGSETNFKKMVELQTQSKVDYNEIFSKLTSKLTDEESATLLKAKTEAPETLRAIRADILNDFFMKSKADASENEGIDLKPPDQMSGLIDIKA